MSDKYRPTKKQKVMNPPQALRAPTGVVYRSRAQSVPNASSPDRFRPNASVTLDEGDESNESVASDSEVEILSSNMKNASEAEDKALKVGFTHKHKP
ncbi:hypothetical protein FRC10_008795 [Ceratobasidium sp. 414]|nr:hypothetical protein FRC10_008795 [Ceratobasidium sp. 414]